MVEIRKAFLKDIPLIRELTLRIWPQTYAPILSQEQIDYMLDLMYSEVSLTRQMTTDSCCFIIIYDFEIPIGFGSFSEIETKKWKLHKLYILPGKQGMGAGRFAIDYILSTIKEQGALVLQLQVNRYNKAKYFYEKLGFREKKITDFDIGNGFFMNDYVMEKYLCPEH